MVNNLAKKQLPFFLPIGCVAADKLGNRCFGGIERSAPGSESRDQIPRRGIAFPRRADVIDGRA